MSFASLSLGERIVLVARMAAQANLENSRQEKLHAGRRSAGGAGLYPVTDDFAPSHPPGAGNGATIAEGDSQ